MERDCRPTVRVLTLALAAFLAVPAAAAPDDVEREIEANETSAVAALEAIRAAQERFKAAHAVDVDLDGVGEYGLLRELTGVYARRTELDGSGTSTPLNEPVLARSFAHAVYVDRYGAPYPFSTGEVSRSGYLFRINLPSPTGGGVAEQWTGPLGDWVGSDLAETTWCCYAWPVTYGETGRRAFFINQTGAIVATDDPSYSGSDRFHTFRKSGAAFHDDSGGRTITGDVAVNATGRDGNYWRLVTPRTRERLIRIHGQVLKRPLYDRYFGRHGFGSFAIRWQQGLTRDDFVVTGRVRGIDARQAYDVVLSRSDRDVSPSLARIRAGEDGGAEFRFDSATDLLRDGLTVADFMGGYVALEPSGYWLLSGRIRPPETTTTEPGLSRISANEAAAVAALRDIAAAQDLMRASGSIDVNGNGVGEYGLSRELTGEYPARTLPDGTGTGTPLRPSLLPPDFRQNTRAVSFLRDGYVFCSLLPGSAGIGVVDVRSGALASTIDSLLAETTWACYAWPQVRGSTGRRTFLVNASGTIVATDAEEYSGHAGIVASNAGAGFAAGQPPTHINGALAADAFGTDGNVWRVVPDRPDDHVFRVHGALVQTPSDGASGEFEIESHQLRNATEETIVVKADGLARHAALRVVLTNEAGDVRADAGTTTSDGDGRARFAFDSGKAVTPGGAATLNAFSGGTIEVLDDADAVLLRGTIPHFATLTGPNDPGASLAYHAAVALTPGPHLRLKRGFLDVRVHADADGTREELTLRVTTFDRLATHADVVAVAGAVDTPLGRIHLDGDRGAGVLRLDTSRGDAVPGGSLRALSGQTIEVRDPTGAVLLTGAFPAVE